jgi:hypothetical protein
MDSEDLSLGLKRKIAEARNRGQAEAHHRIAWAKVDSERITGNTRHYRGASLLRAPDMVEIVKLPSAPGYYLLYLDSAGNELTDTFHESVDQAIEQARFEFGLLAWEGLDS